MTQSCGNCLHSRVSPEEIQVCAHEDAQSFCPIHTWIMLQGCPVGRVMVHCTEKGLWESKEVAAE